MTTPDPRTVLRSKGYLRLLIFAAILGVPVSAAAYGFLALVSYLQKEIFTHLPHGLGFSTEPVWWPLPVLAVGGIITALAIVFLPGTGGASPADGFKMHKAPAPELLPGVILAALYLLWAYQRVFHGEPKGDNATMGDMGWKDRWVMLPLLAAIIFLGVYPKPVLTRIQPSVDAVLAHVHDVTGYQQPAVASTQAATTGAGGGQR